MDGARRLLLVRSTCWASSRSVSRWASESWYLCCRFSLELRRGKCRSRCGDFAFAPMRLISSPFCGWLIKILSERIIMATGIFIVAISSGLAGLSRSYLQLLVLRGVGGIGSAMFTVSAFTLLLTSVEAGVRGRAAGFFQAGFLIGGITGPALGGGVVGHLAHRPFLLRRDTCRRWNVGLVLLRRRSAKPEEQTAEAVPFRAVVRDARYQAACFSNLAQGWTSFGVRSSRIPILVVELLHRPASWTGIAFACAAVAQTIAVGPAGRFTDTVGRRPAMILGTVAAVSIMAVPFAPNIWLLIVVLCLYGIASAFLGTAPRQRSVMRRDIRAARQWRCSRCVLISEQSSGRWSPACWPTRCRIRQRSASERP